MPPRKSKDTDLHERVATLETQTSSTASDIHDLKKAVAALEKALTRYQGAWGAITLIVGAVITFLTIFGSAIAKKLGWAN